MSENKIKFTANRTWTVFQADGTHKTYLAGQTDEEYESNVKSAAKAGTVTIIGQDNGNNPADEE